jgi:hypothetical protein
MKNGRLPAWLVAPTVWLALFPAWLWVRLHERRILKKGRPLDEGELRDAREAGVRDPSAIRVLIAAPVPTPGSALLRCLGRITRFPMEPPMGMALGHGIYLDPRCAGSRLTMVHECVHIAQYETLGGPFAFLRRYLRECIRDSYWSAPMEAEANRIAARVCADTCA